MNILITGANRGLGLCLTKIGLENGHKIFAGVKSTNENNIKELTDLKGIYKDNLQITEMDVTCENSVMKALDEVKKNDSSLDVIINNAGILNEREKTIEELDIEKCKVAFDVNTLGPIRVIKHFLPLLKQGNNQSILNISSEAGSITNSYSGDYPYGLSKIALNMLSEKLDVYLKDKDIQVLSIHPGWMKTDMGGENAPYDPMDTAAGIMEIAERKKKVTSKYAFVDYNGKSMVI